jgi:hypothetical protein
LGREEKEMKRALSAAKVLTIVAAVAWATAPERVVVNASPIIMEARVTRENTLLILERVK